MSVTVTAVPFLLIHAISILGTGVITGVITAAIAESTKNDMKNNNIYNLQNFLVQDTGFENSEVEEIVQKMFEKEIETNFVDRETLLKTLDEHGATITKVDDNSISCRLEQFVFNFYKKDDLKTTPYTLKIECENFENLETTVGELQSEYAMNAQEVSYNLIKKRLEEKNLTIDNEEIYEDDTIVLTVNLE